jgi:glycosyltransferase involved in cell wall biosynthesis
LRHIYWFSYYNSDAPSTRYRAKYAIENLKYKNDITYSFAYPGYNIQTLCTFIIVFLSALLFRKKNSVIVFQRIYTSGIYAKALKVLLFFQKKHTIYDLDDAEYMHFSATTITHFLTYCDACTLGSETLVYYARQFNTNVHLLTSPVIPHAKIKQKRNNILTLGWVGFYDSLDNNDDFSHQDSLQKLFFPAIKNIEFPINLVLLGVRQEKNKHNIKVFFAENPNIFIDIPDNIDWQDELSVYDRIKEFDIIGIAPLLDNEVNRAKSAFKIKQYFSCGVPALASGIGENVRFLEHGKNGFLCETPQDFKDNIVKLKGLPSDEYSRLCQNALATVNSFSMESYCQTFMKIAATFFV